MQLKLQICIFHRKRSLMLLFNHSLTTIKTIPPNYFRWDGLPYIFRPQLVDILITSFYCHHYSFFANRSTNCGLLNNPLMRSTLPFS